MAQWLGQFSGNTHLSKVHDRENQLRHAIGVYRSETQSDRRKGHRDTVRRFAERLLDARIRASKAQVAALDPRDDDDRKFIESKIARMIETGTDAILVEFGEIDLCSAAP